MFNVKIILYMQYNLSYFTFKISGGFVQFEENISDFFLVSVDQNKSNN